MKEQETFVTSDKVSFHVYTAMPFEEIQPGVYQRG
jgi:hypothetical protein